jgi:biotin-[acetyl-CoA-carboxylase] ligase BirA-like protein
MHNNASTHYPPISLEHLKNWWSQNSRTHHPLAIKYIASCESTNSQLYRSPSHANTLLVTETQTQGRGQFEREWQTRAGDLIFSLGVRLHSSKIQALSIRVGLALAQVCAHFGYAAQLKWPNDVILNHGKLAGILVQSNPSNQDQMNWVVIGVGVNIAPRTDLSTAKNTSSAFMPVGLSQVDSQWLQPKAVMRETLIMHMVDEILLHIDGERTLSNEYLSTQWNLHDIWHHQPIVWIDPFGQKHHGIGLGIDENGTYQMDSHRGQVAIYSGQIRADKTP